MSNPPTPPKSVPAGWNDPPTVLPSSTPSPARPKLNKRVAFPMQTPSTTKTKEPSSEFESMFVEIQNNIRQALENMPRSDEIFKIMLSMHENWIADITLEGRQNILLISKYILAGDLVAALELNDSIRANNLIWFSSFFRNVVTVIIDFRIHRKPETLK